MNQVDYIQETDNVEMLEEEAYVAPRVTLNVTPNETKWDDVINTDAVAEHDQDQHGKKRDKSSLTKSDKQDEKESVDSTVETLKYPQTETSSPKRLKKSSLTEILQQHGREQDVSEDKERPTNSSKHINMTPESQNKI